MKFFSILAPLCLGLCATASLFATDYRWSPAQMGPWDQPANWSPSGVPGADDAVTVESDLPLFTAGARRLAALNLTGPSGFIQIVGSGNAVLHIEGGLTHARGNPRLSSILRGHVSFNQGTLGLEAGSIDARQGRLVLGQAHEQLSRALTSLQVWGPLSITEGGLVELYTDGSDGSEARFGAIRMDAGGGSLLLNNGTRSTRSVEAGTLDGGADAIIAGAGDDHRDSATTLKLTGSDGTSVFAGRLRDALDGPQRGNELHLLQSGSFVQVLSGANDYSGNTTVTAGELVIDGDQSAAKGPVRVSREGILAGTGRIGGNTAVEGTLRPGATGLTLLSDLALAPESRIHIGLGSDSSTVTFLDGGGQGRLRLGGTLIIRLEGARLSAGDAIRIFANWPEVNGGFDGIQAEPPGPGLRWDVSRLHTDGILAVR